MKREAGRRLKRMVELGRSGQMQKMFWQVYVSQADAEEPQISEYTPLKRATRHVPHHVTHGAPYRQTVLFPFWP